MENNNNKTTTMKDKRGNCVCDRACSICSSDDSQTNDVGNKSKPKKRLSIFNITRPCHKQRKPVKTSKIETKVNHMTPNSTRGSTQSSVWYGGKVISDHLSGKSKDVKIKKTSTKVHDATSSPSKPEKSKHASSSRVQKLTLSKLTTDNSSPDPETYKQLSSFRSDVNVQAQEYDNRKFELNFDISCNDIEKLSRLNIHQRCNEETEHTVSNIHLVIEENKREDQTKQESVMNLQTSTNFDNVDENSVDLPQKSSQKEESSPSGTFDCDEYCRSACLEIDNIFYQMQEDKVLSDTRDYSEDTKAAYKPQSSFTEDDFESSILEQSGENYIVEAFNDVGNELVITVLEINRKSVSLNPDSLFSEEYVDDDEASIVLHKTEDESNYQELFNTNGTIPMLFESNQSEISPEKLGKTSSFEKFPVIETYNLKNIVAFGRPHSASEKTLCGNQEATKRSFKSMIALGNLITGTRVDSNCEAGDSSVGSRRTSSDDFISEQSCHQVLDSPFGNYLEETGYEDPNEDAPIRRNTVCDNSGNVRIEKFVRISDEPPINENKQNSGTLSRKNSMKKKIDYIVEELVETEDKYVSDLRKVVKEYKPYLDKVSASNKHLFGKSAYVFGNIESIYVSAKRFRDKLKACNGAIDEIGKTFIDFKYMFEFYPLYSKNKPKSVSHLKEFQTFIKRKQFELGDRLDLSSYLLTPIQRLGKYILFLEKMIDYHMKLGSADGSLQTENISKALEIIRNEMRKGNDSIAIDSIKRCPMDLTQQGFFLMTENFQLHKPKKMELRLFLFEKIIVFTTVDSENSEIFLYQGSVFLSDLSIASFETHPTVFHLSDFPRNRHDDKRYTFVLEAKSPKTKDTWTQEIEKLLWKQLEQCKVQTLQRQSDEGSKTFTVPVKRDESLKSPLYKKKSVRRNKSKSSIYKTM